MESTKDAATILDVRSVVEAISTDDDNAPVYQVESLCMRCHENVYSFSPSTPSPPHTHTYTYTYICDYLNSDNKKLQAD